MPNLDGTGPQGKGPLTGRKRGLCRDKQTTKIEKTENQHGENNKSVYSHRRGRQPRRGGGFGNRFSGGYGKGQGRALGRGSEED